MHNLPLKKITDNVLQYLDSSCPGYSKELIDEIVYRGLKKVILFDNRQVAINNVAEINDDRQIIVYEPYIAFLWCLSYSASTLNGLGMICDVEDTNASKLKTVDELFDYGHSLVKIWKEWPSTLPNPNDFDDAVENNPNSLTTISLSFIIAHEIGHHVLGHAVNEENFDFESMKSEELAADKYAFDVISGGYENGNDIKNYSINVSMVLALGSILLLDNSWNGGIIHPDTDDRLDKLLSNIEMNDCNAGEHWTYGLYILVLWNMKYGSEEYDPSQISAKDAFITMKASLRKKYQT